MITKIKELETKSYRLVYDAITKKWIALIYDNYNTVSIHSILTAATYAELSNKATTGGVIRFSAQQEGQP